MGNDAGNAADRWRKLTLRASDSLKLTLTLNADLTFRLVQVSLSGGVDLTTNETGTYSTSGGSVLTRVSSAGSTESGTYQVSGNEMTLVETATFQGQTNTTDYRFKRMNYLMGDRVSAARVDCPASLFPP